MTSAHGITAGSVIETGAIGYVAAAIGYFLLGLSILSWWQRVLASTALAFASIATFLWTAVTAYGLFTGGSLEWLGQVLEIVRTCGWLVLLLSMLNWISSVERSTRAAAVIGLCTLIAAMTLVLGDVVSADDAGFARLAVFSGHLLLALLGMAMIENLFRNSPSSSYWSIKYLCLGVGALFAYDFFYYSDAVLFQRRNVDLLLARGMINGMALPLLAVYATRNRKGGPQIAFSRKLVLHSATLAGAGFYLIIMAAAGYYVRHYGGAWSSFLQTVFFCGAILLFTLPILSGSFRAYFRVLVEKSFFRYKYDYREEWLRFIQTISATDRNDDLRLRVVEAVCDILESPEGGLWLLREPEKYKLVSSWNLSRWELAPAEATIDSQCELARFLEQTQWIVDVEEFARAPERYHGLSEIPDWLQKAGRAWLVVPLIRHEHLFGIMVIGRPRISHLLTWEDIDLLKTVGRQAASYLAERDTSEALAESRQFEEFNKRFAFVAHDVKNLVSQLSLILANAAKHSDNAAFQRDANETLRQSVEKLNRMLRQLNAQPSSSEATKPIGLRALLNEIVSERRKLHKGVALDLQTDTVSVAVDEHRIKTIVEHLLQNAIDAVGDGGHVRVRLIRTDKTAVVEIEDDGPGMDANFVREKLFRPFATTKGSGYGIGMYESREYATGLGGHLDVASEPGRGTIMRVTLPLADTEDTLAK